METRLAALVDGHCGVVSTADARRLAVSPVQLDGLVRSGELLRVRRGAYVHRTTYEEADADERYRLRARAILATRPTGDAASHHAAVMLHGVRTYGVDLSVVDVVSKVKAVRVRNGLRTHPGVGVIADRAPGFNVVALPTAMCQVAGGSGVVPAVCSMDHALHSGRCTVNDLRDSVAHVPEHHRDVVEHAIGLTDAACESVGESRTRLLLRDLGFLVRTQETLRRGRAFVARVDFLVDDLVVVEFDGLVKYEGQDGRVALAAEKARETAIVDLGYEVVRLVWADLLDPAGVARRVREARTRAINRRRATTAWR